MHKKLCCERDRKHAHIQHVLLHHKRRIYEKDKIKILLS